MKKNVELAKEFKAYFRELDEIAHNFDKQARELCPHPDKHVWKHDGLKAPSGIGWTIKPYWECKICGTMRDE